MIAIVRYDDAKICHTRDIAFVVSFYAARDLFIKTSFKGEVEVCINYYLVMNGFPFTR